MLQVMDDVKPVTPEHELAAEELSLKLISDGNVTFKYPFVVIVFFVTTVKV
jgi:hypothetical protein